MKDQTDSSKVLASGRQQSIHQNGYGHSTTPVRITYYIESTEKTGMTTQSSNLMNTNYMVRKYFILYLKTET